MQELPRLLPHSLYCAGGNLITFLLALLFPAIAERQFYDEDIPCLGYYDECEPTESVFKDDEIEMPVKKRDPYSVDVTFDLGLLADEENSCPAE